MQNKHITIFHGPQHPGITGNMSVELDLIGETIQKATTHVGYLHRGFEKLIERRTVIQAFTIVCRICVPEPDPNEVNFAMAVEETRRHKGEQTRTIYSCHGFGALQTLCAVFMDGRTKRKRGTLRSRAVGYCR